MKNVKVIIIVSIIVIAVISVIVYLIINLQCDMPNIKPHSILKLEKLMRKNNCDIGTLASYIKQKDI